MGKKPARRPSDGKVRIWGLGWVTMKTAMILVAIVVILVIVDFVLL